MHRSRPGDRRGTTHRSHHRTPGHSRAAGRFGGNPLYPGSPGIAIFPTRRARHPYCRSAVPCSVSGEGLRGLGQGGVDAGKSAGGTCGLEAVVVTRADVAHNSIRGRVTDRIQPPGPTGAPQMEQGAAVRVPPSPVISQVRSWVSVRGLAGGGVAGGAVPLAGQEQGQRDHDVPQDQVEPVVGGVDRHEVDITVVGDEQAVNPQDEVDDPALQEIAFGSGPGPGQRYASYPEEQVHDMVQDGHLELAQQHCLRVVAGEGDLVEVGRDTGNEPEDPDEQENYTDGQGRILHLGALSVGASSVAVHGLALSEDRGRSDPLRSHMVHDLPMQSEPRGRSAQSAVRHMVLSRIDPSSTGTSTQHASCCS